MKKILKILTIVVVLTLMMATSAFAKSGKGNPKGEVVGIDETAGTVTIFTSDGDTVVIDVPDDFDFTAIELGMTVLAKGKWTDTGFNAKWVKEVVDDETEDDTEDVEEPSGNAWGEGGVYCNGGKENPHPVAQKIAEKYGVDVEWVMSYACDGHGFGGVMLALQTEEAGGDSADEALAKRKDGQGWGQIWKANGLVGNDKADSPPPGLLKKPDKETGKPDNPGNSNKDKQPNPNSNKDKDKHTDPEDDPDSD